jgi:DNA-binding SARP family transcriptional activator
MWMRFRILGRIEVQGVGHLEPREARTLAVLLLSPNRLVTRRRLTEGIWDEAPPATASRQLLNCVSRLRRIVGPDAIESCDAGYQIAVADGELDAEVFAGLVESAAALRDTGHGADAARLLRTALALWRGPALAGLTGRVVEAGAARLDEQRLTVLEQCLELELEHGGDAVIGELAELVDANPLSERPVGLLMLALSRAGRRAEALAAYRDLARRLADELGIDPDSEVRDVYTAILRGDDRTATAPPAVPTPASRGAAARAASRGLAEPRQRWPAPGPA